MNLYKNLMFPKNPEAPKFTMSEIDSMDFGFFDEMMTATVEVEKKVYIDQVW